LERRRIMRKILTGAETVILLLALVGTVYAGGPGTTGANFLKIGVGARAAAMGEAFTAVADDSTSLYWNPAGLARLEKGELSATYNMWFEGVGQGYLSLGFPLLGGTVGMGTNYVTMGDLEGRDEVGNPTETFKASDLSISAGFATRVGRLLLGLSGGMVRSTIAGDTQSAFLGTVGGLLDIGQSFTLGVAAQNLGTKLGEDPLPLVLKGGLALELGFLNLAADIAKPQDDDLYYCAGIEGWIGNVLALRAGYRTGQDIGPGWTAGLGFKTDKFGLDYAYVPYDDLGTTHRISMGIGF
jgi:hypothetical protein